jgi:hypothetical protein
VADGKRPFWMHQLVEYILGGALVASGLQSPTPLVPAVLGGVIMLHAAITKGALAAFRVIDRRLHRVLDPFVIGLCVVGGLQPWVSVESSTRAIVIGIAVVHLVVFFGSSFTERAKAPKGGPSTSQSASSSTSSPAAGGDRSTDLGRTAGRVVGAGVNAVRKMRR